MSELSSAVQIAADVRAGRRTAVSVVEEHRRTFVAKARELVPQLESQRLGTADSVRQEDLHDLHWCDRHWERTRELNSASSTD